jgi:hypothetical protein
LIHTYKDVRNKIRNIIWVGLNHSREAEDPRVEGRQLGFVHSGQTFGLFLLVFAARFSLHFSPDFGSKVFQKTGLTILVNKVGMDEAAENFSGLYSNLQT